MGSQAEGQVLVSAEGALGRIRLNRPEALNSLTPAMIGAIGAGIDRLEGDPQVRAIALTGEGERGLCAGGDIKLLWAMGREAPAKAMAFWAAEYRLNARIHRLQKPWIAVMDGITMGGGVGLSVHGSHRIVTERSRFAMPETGIGYFPDVGASHALPRATGLLGYWIGLTGAPVGAADVLAAGLAEAMVPAGALPALFADLAAGQSAEAALARHRADPGPSELAAARPLIDSVFAAPDMPAILAALAGSDSGFAARTLALLRQRSPGSLVLALHLLRRGAVLPDLEHCLQQEFEGNRLVLELADFYEGIRAAVIDKDRKPSWSPARVEEVDAGALLARLVPVPPLFPGLPAR